MRTLQGGCFWFCSVLKITWSLIPMMRTFRVLMNKLFAEIRRLCFEVFLKRNISLSLLFVVNLFLVSLQNKNVERNKVENSYKVARRIQHWPQIWFERRLLQQYVTFARSGSHVLKVSMLTTTLWFEKVQNV